MSFIKRLEIKKKRLTTDIIINNNPIKRIQSDKEARNDQRSNRSLIVLSDDE